MRQIKAALASPILIKGNKHANILKIRDVINRYKNEDIDIFIFPELSIIGGMWKNAESDYINLSEEVPYGESSNKIKEIAHEFNTTICAGIIEKDNNTYYISHFIYGPEGYLGKQRKIFPNNLTKKSIFESGKCIKGIKLFGYNCAILACADFLLPEPTYQAGLAGCSLIISPTDCFLAERKNIIKNLLQTRAIDIGGCAIGVFGHNYELENDQVLACITYNSQGEASVVETRNINESKVIISEIKLKEPIQKWGGFHLRKNYLDD